MFCWSTYDLFLRFTDAANAYEFYNKDATQNGLHTWFMFRNILNRPVNWSKPFGALIKEAPDGTGIFGFSFVQLFSVRRTGDQPVVCNPRWDDWQHLCLAYDQWSLVGRLESSSVSENCLFGSSKSLLFETLADPWKTHSKRGTQTNLSRGLSALVTSFWWSSLEGAGSKREGLYAAKHLSNLLTYWNQDNLWQTKQGTDRIGLSRYLLTRRHTKR